jgi:N-acetylmuramoyl-L-alanine amidase
LRFDWLIPATVGAASAALVWTLPAEAAQLQSWWFDAQQNRLVFTTDGAVQPRAQLIFNPTRVVIDLPGTTLGRPTANQALGGAVQEVRVGQFNDTTTRLVIELGEGYTVNPRQIEVRGVRSNEWVVQLPTPERTSPSSNAGELADAPNLVNGEIARGAATQVDNVLATPDGFFVRTRGQAPDIEVARRGGGDQPRQIFINIRDSSISPLLRPEILPVSRYSVSRWEINQLQQDPPVTQLVLTLAPGSPDWQVSASNLGGIVLLPPAGVYITDIPDQSASASRPITVPPGNNNPPALPLPNPPLGQPPINNSQAVVVLDPGHGGRDPGAVGIGGLQEKTIVLPVTLRVAEILRDRGVQVILTRPDDRSLDLEPRVQIANRANATIFVSIHANAISMSRPDVNGVETYFYSESGRRLAETLHASILPASGMRDRGVKQARFYVLRNTAMPASLLEIGFVTGREDAPLLSDPVWRERMAQAIADGIVRYLQGG